MKFATVLMSLMFAGVFAQAQGGAEVQPAAPAEVKQEVKTEKSSEVKVEKKHKHGKKEKPAAEPAKQ